LEVSPAAAGLSSNDHLAGSLGTGLLALMLRKGWLQGMAADARRLELRRPGARKR